LQEIESGKPKLVAFDVEGVLIPKNRFMFEMGKSLGIIMLLRVFFYGFLYEIGLISLKRALRTIFKGAHGMKIETLLQIAAKIPLMPDAKEVFQALGSRGFKTALISSGLPSTIVKEIAEEVGANYGYGFEVGTNADRLTGEIWGDVIEQNGKMTVLERIIESECLKEEECVIVADDRNNASMFLKKALKIGYNPDFMLRIKADKTVTGKMVKVLAIINGEPKHHGKLSKNDAAREIIHASGIFVPILAALIGIPIVSLTIIAVLVLYLVSEYMRTEGKRMPIIYSITRGAAAPTELYQLVLAPAYFATGILLALLLFPMPANYAAIAIFTLGDSFASIFGSTFSKTKLPFNKDKSLEGSTAGFIAALIGGSVFVSPLFALVGALVAMIVESLPLPINDNLMIPICTGIALTLIL
jgi:phosphoserine phosphatase